MKRFFWTLAFCLTAAAAMTVLAQPPAGGPGPEGRGPGGGFGRGFGGPGALLQNDKVKTELNLTDEQVAQLKKVSEELQPPRRERGGSREQAGPGGSNQPPSREEFEKRRSESQNKVNQILTPEQQAKLQVLTFQTNGGLDSPFLGARSLETLGLTEEQKAKIKVIEEQRGEKFRAAFQDARNLSQEERDKRRAELETSGKEFAQQIKAVLTPEQKTKAEQLTAEAKEVRSRLGIPEAGQRGGQQREQRRDGERGDRGGDGYRPGANSWQPGQGAAGQEPQDSQPKKRFPRSEKPAEN